MNAQGTMERSFLSHQLICWAIVQMLISPSFPVYAFRDPGFDLTEALSSDALKQMRSGLGGIVECSDNADLVIAKPFSSATFQISLVYPTCSGLAAFKPAWLSHPAAATVISRLWVFNFQNNSKDSWDW